MHSLHTTLTENHPLAHDRTEMLSCECLIHGNNTKNAIIDTGCVTGRVFASAKTRFFVYLKLVIKSEGGPSGRAGWNAFCAYANDAGCSGGTLGGEKCMNVRQLRFARGRRKGNAPCAHHTLAEPLRKEKIIMLLASVYGLPQARVHLRSRKYEWQPRCNNFWRTGCKPRCGLGVTTLYGRIAGCLAE